MFLPDMEPILWSGQVQETLPLRDHSLAGNNALIFRVYVLG